MLTQTLFKNNVIEENTVSKVVVSLTWAKNTKECLMRKCASCTDKKINFKTVDKDLTKEIVYKKWVTVKQKVINEKTQKEKIVQKKS